jgi:ATP-binding cassette subfamily F protein 3
VTADTLLLVDGGDVDPFDGDLDDYPAWLAARDPDRDAEDDLPKNGADRKQQRRERADQRKVLAPLRGRLTALEREIEGLESRRQALGETLAAPELYEPGAKERLLTLLAEQREIEARLGEREAEWLELGEELERRQALGA